MVECASDCLPVLLAAGRGSRMYPITDDCPKCLLPVGNKPLIWYPMQLLERSGFQEAVVVVRETEQKLVLEELDQFSLVTTVVPIPDGEDWGTADSLRFLRNKMLHKHSDILVLSCDLVTLVELRRLAELHACRQSTLTCLFTHPQDDTLHKPQAFSERDIIGLSSNERLVYFSAQADLDDALILSRSLMKRHPHIQISSQLVDAHVYLMKKWVVDYLADNRNISSVKGELVPHLVRYQWLEVACPAGQQSGQASGHLGSTVSVSKQALQAHASSCVDKTEQLALELSSFAGCPGESEALTRPLILCHALKVAGQLCLRVNSISSYMAANRKVPHHLSEFHLSSQPAISAGKSKGVSSGSVVGEGVVLGEKVSVKHSSVGHHCTIADKSKITNTILMNHVTVGESCTLHGCVVCSHVHVEDHVSLRDCIVGANFTVARDGIQSLLGADTSNHKTKEQTDMKGETLVSGGGLHF